jgi:hypothetical protein
MEELNDNFRIELEDDELQRGEMEEREMEKEKERRRRWSWSRGKRKSCQSHPFPISKGLLVLATCQQMMIQDILSVFVVFQNFMR